MVKSWFLPVSDSGAFVVKKLQRCRQKAGSFVAKKPVCLSSKSWCICCKKAAAFVVKSSAVFVVKKLVRPSSNIPHQNAGSFVIFRCWCVHCQISLSGWFVCRKKLVHWYLCSIIIIRTATGTFGSDTFNKNPGVTYITVTPEARNSPLNLPIPPLR